MKLSTVIAVGAVAYGSLILASPTIASTIVRTTSWIMNQEREICIKEAIKVANQSGFSERHEVVESDLNLPISAFYAFSKTGPYAMSVECNEDRGTSSLAVSGIGNHDADFSCCAALDQIPVVPTQVEPGVLRAVPD